MRKVKNLSENNKIRLIILAIFIICSLFHYFEVLVIRTEETFLADNFINKIFGIIVLLVCLKKFKFTWNSIGFREDKIIYIFAGLGIGLFCYTVAYGVEYLILSMNNSATLHMEWYVTGFSLSGNIAKQTGFMAFLLCILFNIINVVMEEGIFRGLFIKLGMRRFHFSQANLFAAFLFGIWHLSEPIKNLLDKQMNISTAVIMGIGYVFLAIIMGIKWGLWLQNTDCLWFGIAEHFFNNTIGNILHVVSLTGEDELQIIRIIIAQILSLIITLIFLKKKHVGNRA